jgi:hypothetical protein
MSLIVIAPALLHTERLDEETKPTMERDEPVRLIVLRTDVHREVHGE